MMIELIVILCLIWNTMYLLSSSRESYVCSEWDYEAKLVYFEGDGWGQGQILIVPKNRRLNGN